MDLLENMEGGGHTAESSELIKRIQLGETGKYKDNEGNLVEGKVIKFEDGEDTVVL
jgi:hypothetical protein